MSAATPSPCPRCPELEARCAELERRIARLEHREEREGRLSERVLLLEAENRDLKARVNRTSRNSSKPPSSDPPGAPPRPAAKPSGRKPGGQPGHEGSTRQEFSAQEIDQRVTLRPRRCRHCAQRLSASAPSGGKADRRQVVEIPPATATVTEYVLENVQCPGCGGSTLAEVPPEIDGVVGPRLQALVTLLTGRYRLSKREAREAVEAMFGPKARMSLGLISTLEDRTSEALVAAHEEARAAVQSATVAHADETSMPQKHKKGWLWGLFTPHVAYYLHHQERSRAAAEDLLGEFRGSLVVDRWLSYRYYKDRAACYAHLQRDFQELVDRGAPGATLGKAGRKAIDDIFDLWHQYEEGHVKFRRLGRRVARIRTRLRTALERGTRNGDPKAAAMAKDLLRVFPTLWTWTRREGVPLTNNLAERFMRPAVLWRKGSFGTHSPRGSRFLERILTVVQTLRARGRSVLDFLDQAVRAARRGSDPPPLLSG